MTDVEYQERTAPSGLTVMVDTCELHADHWSCTHDSAGNLGMAFTGVHEANTPESRDTIRRVQERGFNGYSFYSDLHSDGECEYPLGSFVPMLTTKIDVPVGAEDEAMAVLWARS